MRNEIKQDKEDSDEVIAHIEFHAGILEGFEAAFIWGVFFAVRLIGSNQLAEDNGSNADGQSDDNEQQNRKVIFQHVQIPVLFS